MPARGKVNKSPCGSKAMKLSTAAEPHRTIGPYAARADADIVEGDSLGGRLLDLVLEEKRSERLNSFQRVSAA